MIEVKTYVSAVEVFASDCFCVVIQKQIMNGDKEMSRVTHRLMVADGLTLDGLLPDLNASLVADGYPEVEKSDILALVSSIVA